MAFQRALAQLVVSPASSCARTPPAVGRCSARAAAFSGPRVAHRGVAARERAALSVGVALRVCGLAAGERRRRSVPTGVRRQRQVQSQATSATEAGRERGPRLFRILVLSADNLVRNLLRTRYEILGYLVASVSDPAEAARIMQTQTPDLVVIDSDAGQTPGSFVAQQAMKELRQLPGLSKAPQFMLLLSPQEMVASIGALGAAHCLVKPFTQQEVRERTEVALMIAETTKQQGNPENWDSRKITHVVVGGRIMINFMLKQVYKDGLIVELTTMEYEILKRLALHPTDDSISNTPVTKESLRGYIDWLQQHPEGLTAGEGRRRRSLVSDRAIVVHIHRLREKLEDTPRKPSLIITKYLRAERKYGYSLAQVDNIINTP